MTKRQRNHKVKTYYEKYFKNKRIKDEHSIQFIKNPSKRLQLEAVKQNGNSIQYIYTPSKEVQLEAVKHGAYDIKYINNPYLLVRMANIWYKIMNKFK